MDAQDFRSLQEAYDKVYQLDEISAELAKSAAEERMNRTFALMQKDWKSGRKTPSQEFQKSYKKQQDDERRYRKKLKKEQVDLYDIILSHLLDEGYAETEESAHKIMVNMSEEWRDSIVDEMLGEGWKTELAKRALKKVGKEVRKSDAYKKAKRFAVTTALGAVGVPLIS